MNKTVKRLLYAAGGITILGLLIPVFVFRAFLGNTAKANVTALNGNIVQASSKGAELEKKRKEAEQKKQEAAARTEKLKKETQSLQHQADDILAYLEEIDKKQTETMLEMEAAQAEADRITAEYNVACEDLEAAEIALAKQYEAMKKRVRYIYENGQMEQLELYLKSKSISDILNTSEYIKKINEYDHNLLEKYARMKADVQTRKDILEQQKIAMDSANLMYEEEAKYIQSIIVAKQDAFAKYEELIGANEELLEVYLTELATAQKTLDQAIAEQQAYIKEQEEIRRRQLEEARRREMEEASRKAQQQKQQQQQNGGNNNSSSNVTPQNNAAGITQTDVTDINKMIWPLPGDHRTASKFGPRVPPCAGASSFHKGWDIGGKLGAQIVSVLAGTVTTAGYNSSSGNQVVVNHGNGYSTHYMHMSKILVTKGQKVKQGEVLGLVGSTGVSTAPHLHFSLSKNGTMIDPAPYLQKLQ